jgi:hypothetical protein
MNAMHIGQLPKDMHNEIAQYLPFNGKENDQECINRCTKLSKIKHTPHKPIQFTCKTGTLAYENYNSLGQFGAEQRQQLVYRSNATGKSIVLENTMTKGVISNRLSCALSLDHSKVLCIKISNNRFYAAPYFTIYDLTENNGHKKLCSFNISQETQKGAITSDGTTLAFSTSNDHQLEIHHIPQYDITKLTTETVTPPFKAEHLHFNKQGTCLFAMGKDDSEFFIHKFASQEEHENKSKKTLETYFAIKGVCKKICPALIKTRALE